jgi:hypothetical protein
VMYLYAFQINPKPSISHMGATKRNNFGQQPTAYYHCSLQQVKIDRKNIYIYLYKYGLVFCGNLIYCAPLYYFTPSKTPDGFTHQGQSIGMAKSQGYINTL